MQRLDDLPADRQAQAGVLPEALALRPFRVEAVENVLQVGIGDARPIVLHAEFRKVAGGPHAHDDPPARRQLGRNSRQRRAGAVHKFK